MAETKWCPSCGAEYVARVSVCADCDVALLDAPPEPPASDDRDADSGETLEYDLTDWDEDMRGSLEWMLRGRDVGYSWDQPGILVVRERDESIVDGFIDYLSEGPADLADSDEWATAAPGAGASSEITLEEFYEDNPVRRDSEAVGYGREWTDADGTAFDLAWLEDTGELYLMGVYGRVRRLFAGGDTFVEVLGAWPRREDVDSMLAGWEQAMSAPNSVQWIRERVGPRPSSSSAPPAEEGDGGWTRQPCT